MSRDEFKSGDLIRCLYSGRLCHLDLNKDFWRSRFVTPEDSLFLVLRRAYETSDPARDHYYEVVGASGHGVMWYFHMRLV